MKVSSSTSVRENLLTFAYALRGVPLRTACERIDAFAAAVGFTEQVGQHFTALSGGQKQLVIVLSSLLHQPKVVLLDEPSKSLDPVTAERVRTFLGGQLLGYGLLANLAVRALERSARNQGLHYL